MKKKKEARNNSLSFAISMVSIIMAFNLTQKTYLASDHKGSSWLSGSEGSDIEPS
jgi:hypothetical protein